MCFMTDSHNLARLSHWWLHRSPHGKWRDRSGSEQLDAANPDNDLNPDP